MKLTIPKVLFAFVFAIIFIDQSFAQSRITGVVKGLANKDSAIVRIQKSSDEFLFRKIGGNPSNLDVPFDFPNLANGKWALSIDAKGYLFPVAKVIELNGSTSENIITLTPAPADSNYFYTWQDDSSYVGHAQMSYINTPVTINVLGKAERVPDDFHAINLLNEYGFLLSDQESIWTSEDAYRLFVTLKRLNYPGIRGQRDTAFVTARWTISDDFIDRDISFTRNGDILEVRISRAAFTYATPLVVTIDRLKGKFFSKRLFNALVYLHTDKGTNQYIVDNMARERYGFEFLTPGPLLKQVMGETESNFQEFQFDEKLIILSMIEEFPEPMHKQDGLKYMVRRINGQPNPGCPSCAALASNDHIEFMEIAFKNQDINYMQRLVLHEKAHFLWAYTFDSTTKKDWTDLGGWFLDPTSASGWSTSNTTEFVSAYAHLKNPNEDMAESIAWYITNPDGLRSRSIKKFEFIRDRIMNGTRYISRIREDLTFQVYNLFPDYYYPGKIIRTKIEVIGKADEDKKVIVEIELNTEGDPRKGAVHSSIAFISSIGTGFGVPLVNIDANNRILRGSIDISKYVKSGYWNAFQIATYDEVWNGRFENPTTYGLKCFINNPQEDILPPLYIDGTLQLDSTSGKFVDYSGLTADKVCGSCADTIQPMPALRIRMKIKENKYLKPNGRVYGNINIPKIDSTDKYNPQPASKHFDALHNTSNDFPDSIRYVDHMYPILDYYPSGYYSIPHLMLLDIAGNDRRVLFDLDTGNTSLFSGKNQRGLRDSVYFKTKYPDYKPPLIDLNRINIRATPTNPDAPNGETLFEMWLWVKDTSDFPLHAAGIKHGWYTLRDPQGKEHTVSMQGGFGNKYYSEFLPDSSNFTFKQFYFKTLLPIGSAPGLWGVSSINVFDHAMNIKYYSFTEIIRFDVDKSDLLQVTPYVEILGKKVNAKNVDSVSVKIGCVNCKDQFYRLRMYSSMGGTSVVYDGKMSADTITLQNLQLNGVNDGILYASLFMMDLNSALIGTGRAVYTKDTQIPKSEQLKMNLANFGKSNLDSLIIDIKTTEKNGTYNLVAVQSSVTAGSAASNIGSMMTLASGTIGSIGDSLVLSGSFTNGTFQIPGSLIKSMLDGVIELRFYLIDSVGNIGEPIKTTVYKDTKDPVATIKKASESGLNTVVNLSTNEFVSNTLGVQSFKVVNATIQAVEKIDSRNFKITLKRICADTLKIELPAGLLTDTVGNLNQVTSFQAIDKLVPALPTVTSLSYCQGATSNALSATAGAGNTLLWYGNNATGGDPITTAPTPITSTVGTANFYVTQRNNETQCESQRAVIAVVVNAIPQKPTVTRDANANLVSNASAGNQWYKEGVSIQGATGVSYKPTEVAYYSVSSTVNGCAGPQSENYYYLSTSVLDFTNGEFVKFFPNPIVSSVRLSYSINGIQQVELKILDQSGKQVKSFNKIKNGTPLTLDGLKSGVYYFIISTKEKGLIYSQSLIKQ
jgi:hypothetical protein